MHRNKGFTLIEVMIVVAIVGILASVAYPSYQEHLRSSRRTAAQGCLMEQTHAIERFYSANMTYVGAGAALPACPGDVPRFYNVAPGPLGQSTYTLTATPTGAQAGDRCGNMTVNHQGARTPAACWR